MKKFGLTTKQIGREAKPEDFFRYFRDVEASRLRNLFRQKDLDQVSGTCTGVHAYVSRKSVERLACCTESWTCP
jgi:hypothetical protein